MPAIETVLFDMDGVLAHYDFARRLEMLATSTSIEAAEIEARIFTSGFDARADDGAYDSAGYLSEFSRRLGTAVSLDDWLEARVAGMTLNLGTLALAREVERRSTIAMLTNNGPVLREHLSRVAPEIAALFGERAFFSCQFGTGKTSPDVFPLVLAEIGGTPGSTLFIDDSAEYLENARVAGLRTHHFRDAKTLRDELVVLGLI